MTKQNKQDNERDEDSWSDSYKYPVPTGRQARYYYGEDNDEGWDEGDE